MSDSDSSAPDSSSDPPSAAAGFIAPTIEDLNTRLPQFEFIEVLGVGGMGAVYKARQPKLNRFVAIKILPRMENGDHSFVERFEREAQSMAQLSHPHIVPVYDFGETADGQLYFVMEFVEGADLHQLIHGGQLTLEHFYSWIPQICSALEYAHANGIVHRDIKPANILINLEGQVRIADFGLAKLTSGDLQPTPLTHKDLSMGTPDYAAPEQIDADREIDGRVDIYALGVVMYQMLTGKVPRGAFRNPSDSNTSVGPQLDQVVLQAMQAAPADRFQHATEISSRLHQIQSGESDVKEAVPVAELAPPSRAKPITLAIVAALAVALIAGVIYQINSSSRKKAVAEQPPADATISSTNSGKEKEKGKAKAKPGPRMSEPTAEPEPLPVLDLELKPDKTSPEKPAVAGSETETQNNPRPGPGKGPGRGPAGKAKQKMGGGGGDPGSDIDRRRKMFGDQSNNERKTVANLTIISRGQRPIEVSPLASVPEELGNVARLVVGQAPGKQSSQTAFAVAQNIRGELFGWGDNRHNQLDIPDEVREVATDLIRLKAGSAHVLALDRDGKVYAWGRTQEGQCAVPEDLPAASQIAAGPMFSAALLRDGRVVAWGRGDVVGVPANLEPVAEIAAGFDNLLARHTDGTVTAWGSNQKAAANTPDDANVIDIACAENQHFALLEDGQLLAWSERTAFRPLPKVVAREIHGAHDTLAIRLDAGSWIFFGRDSRSTPVLTQHQRRHFHAAVIQDLVFTWSFDPSVTPSLTNNDTAAGADPPTEDAMPPAAASAIAEVQQRFEELFLERVETPYTNSVANLNEFYLKYLEADAGTAQTNAQLSALLAIQAESERIGNGEAVPDSDEEGTPAALANRRAVYRTSMQQFRDERTAQEIDLNQDYLDKLDLMKEDFTREGKTDEALAIRAFRERFAATRDAEAAMQGAGDRE